MITTRSFVWFGGEVGTIILGYKLICSPCSLTCVHSNNRLAWNNREPQQRIPCSIPFNYGCFTLPVYALQLVGFLVILFVGSDYMESISIFSIRTSKSKKQASSPITVNYERESTGILFAFSNENSNFGLLTWPKGKRDWLIIKILGKRGKKIEILDLWA